MERQVEIKNYNPKMQYRRFGKTNQYLSTITLGGMRYVYGNEKPKDEVPKEMLLECMDNIRFAFANGVNHIETAYGYGKSEHCYGIALNDELKIPRSHYHLMTKGDDKFSKDDKPSASIIRRKVEEELQTLKTSYFDTYAWHGLNTMDLVKSATKKGGSVEELLKMKEEGMIHSVGFSTHGPLDTIVAAIETDLFDFINLHYYYFFQRNHPAIEKAAERDMGVFIISPNDKGGQLFHAPTWMRKATFPLTPIQWNARFCLADERIHTLTFGMTQKEHHEEAMGIFQHDLTPTKLDQGILQKMDATAEKAPQEVLDELGDGYKPNFLGYEMMPDPSGINLPELIRFYKMWKHFKMDKFVTYRYNMLEQNNHWFPGEFATDENIAKIDTSKIPTNYPLKKMLADLHGHHFIEKED